MSLAVDSLTLMLLSTDQVRFSSTLLEVVFSKTYSCLKPVPAERTQPGKGTSIDRLALASVTNPSKISMLQEDVVLLSALSW